MDRLAPGVWCVLALLVVSAAVSRADIPSITLESMTWTAESLTVCATDLSTDATSYRLTVNANPQTAIDGESDDGNPICALFDITGLSSVPLATETKYELTAFYNASVELQSGAVTFAFPLSQGTTVSCGDTSQFGRFVVDSEASVPDASCISDSASGVCYVNTDGSGTLCVPGLDENTAGFEVCVPSVPTDGITDAQISAVSLTYNDYRNSGSFTISPGIDPSTNSLELLIQTSTDTPTPSVTTCDGNACSFDGIPSINLYDLCSVSVDSDGNVASVGTYAFQDLQLTVDVVGDTTVDFRFANLNTPDLTYDVYGGDSAEDLTTNGPTFTLDCIHISEDSFCNGFFDDNPSPAYIGVSFLGENDIVIAPTTTPTTAPATATSITSTASTTSDPAAPPKVEENAMDLTDQKTEGVVPSSA